MNQVKKGLLIIEIVICFWYPFLLLLFGTLMLPMVFYAFIQGFPNFITNGMVSPAKFGTLVMLFMIVGGNIGLVSLFVVVRKIFYPEKNFNRPNIIRIGMLIGLISLVGPILIPVLFYTNQIDLGDMLDAATNIHTIFYTWVPVVCTIHIAYLGEVYEGIELI